MTVSFFGVEIPPLSARQEAVTKATTQPISFVLCCHETKFCCNKIN